MDRSHLLGGIRKVLANKKEDSLTLMFAKTTTSSNTWKHRREERILQILLLTFKYKKNMKYVILARL